MQNCQRAVVAQAKPHLFLCRHQGSTFRNHAIIDRRSSYRSSLYCIVSFYCSLYRMALYHCSYADWRSLMASSRWHCSSHTSGTRLKQLYLYLHLCTSICISICITICISICITICVCIDNHCSSYNLGHKSKATAFDICHKCFDVFIISVI